MNQRFLQFLDELALAMGFPSLFPDSEGACLIALEKESLELLFELDEQLVPNTILLSSFLIPLLPKNKVEILETCLKANAKMDETLSCKPDEEMLYLHIRIHPDIRATELESLIKSFIAQATLWRQKIQDLSEEGPKSHRFPLPPPTFELPGSKA